MSDQNNAVFSVAHTKSSIIPKGAPAIAWAALMIAWLSYAGQSAVKTAVFALMPLYGTEFNLGAVALFAFPLIFTFMQAPLAPSLTHATDRLGGGFSRRHMTMIATFLYAFFAMLIGFKELSGCALGFGILVVGIALFIGPCEPLVCAMAADWFPMESRGFALGFHHTGYPWGSFLAGTAASALIAYFGSENWRNIFVILAALPSIAIIWWLRYQITLKKQHQLIKQAEGSGMHISVVDEKLPDEESAPKEVKLGLWEAWKLTCKNPTAFISIINGFLICGSYWVWASFLPMWIFNVGKYSAAETAGLTVVFAITGGVGQIAWGSISDKLGRKFSLMVIFLWAICGFYLMQFSLLSLAMLVGIQLFIGFATNAPYPLFYTVAYDVSDKKTKGAAMAFMDAAFYAGGILLLVTGLLIEAGGGLQSATGYFWVLYMLMIIYGVAFILTLLISRETKGWFFKKDFSLFSRAKSNIPEIN